MTRSRRNRVLARTKLRDGSTWFLATRKPHGYLLEWTRTASVAVSDEGRISLRLHGSPPAVSVQVVRHMAEAYAQSLRGTESLHATCLTRNGRSIAFLANSGVGKSTLAAAMIESGWQLVSDDVLYLRIRGNRVWPIRKRPWIKTARPLKSSIACRREYDPNLEKHVHVFPLRMAGSPLIAFVLLRRRSQGQIRRMRIVSTKAAAILAANMYNAVILTPEIRKRQFELAARLVGLVPTWTLSYPSGIMNLTSVAGQVEEVSQITHSR